jgi:hypothetical protein
MAVSVKFDREGMMRDIRRAFATGVSKVSLRVQEEIVETLSYPGKGKREMIGRTKKGRKRWTPNPRSLPGDPPARQTGALRRSWRTGIKSSKVFGNNVALTTGSDLVYAKHLETGTRRMRARPYLERSIRAVRDFDSPTAREIVLSEVARVAKKYGSSFGIRVT